MITTYTPVKLSDRIRWAQEEHKRIDSIEHALDHSLALDELQEKFERIGREIVLSPTLSKLLVDNEKKK